MIKKLTSGDFMDILDTCRTDIESLQSTVNIARKNIETQANIMRNTLDYSLRSLQSLEERQALQAPLSDVNAFILADNELMGEFDSYGLTVHPKFLRTPSNIFNFRMQTGPVYKNNALVRINGKEKLEYQGMLMHDAIDQKYAAFEELDTDTVELEIEVDPNNLLGATAFNTIEFLPFIPGSFTINRIDIYTMQDYKTKDLDTPSYSILSSFDHVGPSRLLLENTFDLYKCVFQIQLHFKNANEKFPFGFRHIYFLNADYNMDSSIILPIHKDTYIDWVSEDIQIRDQYGYRETTCTEEKIKSYMSYINGNLDFQIGTSKGLLQRTIPKNIHDMYVHIPLTKSLISIKFNTIATR